MTSRILLLAILYADIKENDIFVFFFLGNLDFRASDLENGLTDFDDT